MKTKAYIVANEVQERYILKKLEKDGFLISGMEIVEV